MSKNWPKYPTVLFGFVWGALRLETCGGGDVYEESKPHFLFLRRPAVLKDEAGDEIGTFAVTHLQKKSRLGFLWD